MRPLDQFNKFVHMSMLHPATDILIEKLHQSAHGRRPVFAPAVERLTLFAASSPVKLEHITSSLGWHISNIHKLQQLV